MAPLESLPALAGQRQDAGAKNLLVHPAKQGAIELHQLLTRSVGQDRTTLPLVHEIPHRRDGWLSPALIGDLGIVGYEVELAAAVVQTTLFDFMGAHGRLVGVNSREIR